MRIHALFVAALAVILCGAASSSQQVDEAPRACAEVEGDYEAVSREVEALRGTLRALEQQAAPDAGEIERSRARLAALAFRRECLRPDLEPDPIRGPTASQPNWVTLTTFYATNRRAAGMQGTIAQFSSERESAGIRFGRTTVSIPTRRSRGELNLPWNLWLFELPADPDRHFIIRSVTPLRPQAALSEMRARIAGSGNKSLLIFVHGYNTDFGEAAMRTAQLAHDLNFPGMPIFFSWPSHGTAAGYPHDEEVSELSLGAFNQLLDRVETLQASAVFIVAHSMGNRIVTRALAQRLAAGRAPPANLRALLLAAPDINADIFREQIAPGLARLTGTRRTIYASNNDAALRVSSILHDFPRVGLTSPSVHLYDGFETIDASAAAPMRRGLGHSYVVDSIRVLRDMQLLIFRNLPADSRGLARASAGAPPRPYWKIQ